MALEVQGSDVAAGAVQAVVFDGVKWLTRAGLVVREFSIAYNTANLLTGVPLWRPAVGDLILALWLNVQTPWDGTTPTLSVGAFLGGFPEGLGAYGFNQSVAADVSQASVDPADPAYTGGVYPLQGSIELPPLGVSDEPGSAYLITAPNPIQALVSQTGLGASLATATSANQLFNLPITVVTGTNDQFTFNSVTYTVAPGTYSTGAAVAAAMLAATASSVPLSNVLSMGVNANGSLVAAALTVGTALNGVGFGAGGNDFLAGSGWAADDVLLGGTTDGGSPGSTMGAATICVLTATPYMIRSLMA